MNKPINEQMESEFVARPQADPKQNEFLYNFDWTGTKHYIHVSGPQIFIEGQL